MAARERGAVMITGTSTGIGEACALRLDGLGFEVFAGVRRKDDGERLKARASGRLRPVIIDVTEQHSIDNAREEVADTVGDRGLAGLVNNAGGAVPGPLEFVPIDDLRRQLELNTIAQVAVTQAFMPAIRAGRGRVLFIGSIGGKASTGFNGPYAASKHAIEAIGDALRQELAPWDIHVAVIEPGAVKTEIWRKGLEGAEADIARLPPEGRELYEGSLRDLVNAVAAISAGGIEVDRVAQAVEHALTASRPKTRYLVGSDARMQLAARRLLTDRGFDRAVGVLLRRMSREGAKLRRSG
jgi:NADP-dependent 3-hydroxy acid dehydrogenase YdfG